MIQSDFSGLEGTQCYCSEQSASLIREEIGRLPLEGVHFIGTGDYHYVSLFWLERICEPFTLVLFDNHPDDQQTAFGPGLLSCGSWVAEARRLPCCETVSWNTMPKEGSTVYLSIDLDVLSPEFAHTNWDQGTMSLDALTGAIRDIISTCRVIGADICGGLSEEKGGTEEDAILNGKAVRAICDCFERR